MSFSQFSPISEHAQSPPFQASTSRQSTPGNIRSRSVTASAKKQRKQRGGSTTASPAIFPSELQGTQWSGAAGSSSQGSGNSQAQAGRESAAASPTRTDGQGFQGDNGTTERGEGSSGDLAGNIRSSVTGQGMGPADEDVEADDDLLPDMADDDYSAQLSWQSQSKDNLKVLMDNFTPEQYDRYEAYRRNALPKQAVRRVVQQTLGQQVSTPVAQVIAGFGKVFVGEIVEKARAVQQRRGERGPLSPDHLREAYREYQEETGRVGAARPMRGKRLFVR